MVVIDNLCIRITGMVDEPGCVPYNALLYACKLFTPVWCFHNVNIFGRYRSKDPPDELDNRSPC